MKNEEKFLERCLTSLQGKVDEIIIVDTGSTDSTISIAQRFTKDIYFFKWNNSFADARNYSISFAKSDYILVLDADEYLDTEADIQDTLSYDKDYYMLNIKNELDNNYFIHHQAIRLFKNKIGFKFVGAIHEHLNIADYPDRKNALSDILLVHTGYKKEVVNDQNKNTRNLELLLQEVHKNPNAYNYFNLGVQYKVDEKYELAFECLKKSFNFEKDSIYMPYLLYHMVDCFYNLKKYEKGITLAIDAIASFPNYPDLYYILGLLYKEYGYLEDAKLVLKKAVDIGEIKGNPSLEGVGSYLSNYQLALITHEQGRNEESIEYLIATLKLKKNYSAALALYLKILEEIDLEIEESYRLLLNVTDIKSNEDLDSILKILFLTRSPLFNLMISSLNVENDFLSKLIQFIYSNEMLKAKDIVYENTLPNNKSELEGDILILALVTRDKKMLEINGFENGIILYEYIVNNSIGQIEMLEDSSLYDVFLKLIKIKDI
ncbi:glycosyltransferase, partial [Robertmurraya sp. Marseille-Q9965]